jgi:hypothetical protein
MMRLSQHLRRLLRRLPLLLLVVDLPTLDCWAQSDTRESASAGAAQAEAFRVRSTYHSSTGSVKGDARAWTLTDRTQLYGRAQVDIRDIVTIQRDENSGPGPKAVYAYLSDFSAEDQAAIRSGLPNPAPENRQYAIYQGIEATPQWQAAHPPRPEQFQHAVAIEGEKVVFSAGPELHFVPKAALKPESFEQIAAQLKTVRRQIVLDATRASITAVGQPFAELPDAFAMEVTALYAPFQPAFAVGTRYLLPKHSLPPSLVAPIRSIVERVAGETSGELADAAALEQLPLLCNTTDGLMLVEVPVDAQAAVANARTVDGEPTTLALGHLMCSDQQWWELHRLKLDSATGPEHIDSIVLARLVEAAAERKRWALKAPLPDFFSNLVGRVANGLVFEKPGAGRYFVPAKDLEEIDRRVALLATQLRGTGWLADADLPRIMATRILPHNHANSFGVVQMKSQRFEQALVGEVPIVLDSAKPSRRLGLNWHAMIRNAVNARRWLEENQQLLAGRDPAQLLEALDKKYPLSDSDRELDANTLPGLRVRHWALSHSDKTFQGALVGKIGDDLVFERQINGKAKSFLVALKALADEGQELAKELLTQTPPRDWSTALTRASNWQHYRVWHDPEGKLPTVLTPSVVETIGNAQILFRGIDGVHASLTLPKDEDEQEQTVAFFEPAIESAIKRKQAAEAAFALWQFEDCDVVLRADLIGVAGDSFLVRDVNQSEFLVNKFTLAASSREQLATQLKTQSDLKTVESADVWKLQRVWCTPTELVGPATPEFLTDDDQRLIVRTSDGSKQALATSDFMLQEKLSFITAFRLAQGGVPLRPELATAENLEALETSLSQAVPANEVLESCPDLDPRLEREIADMFQQRPPAEWPATPAQLPSGSRLLAVNQDATGGVIAVDGQWQVVDLTTGVTKPLPAAAGRGADVQAAGEPEATAETPGAMNSDSQSSGPWIAAGDAQVLWVSEGKLLGGRPGEREPRVLLPANTPKILAACQTSNWQSLVLLLDDRSVRRWQSPDGPLEVVVRNHGNAAVATAKPRITASADGADVLISTGRDNHLHVSTKPGTPALKGEVFRPQAMQFAAVGAARAWLSHEATPRRVSEVVAAPAPLPAKLTGLPFACSWLDIVQADNGPCLQAIGRGEDAESEKSQRSFVIYRSPRGGEVYQTQSIQGQIDSRARMAANGAALVHWRGDQVVISRRPPLVGSPLRKLMTIVERLVTDRNIGQLEALARLLDRPPYHELGPHAGSLGFEFQAMVKLACFNYQPQLAGDRLGRAIQLADKLREQFPASQVAGALQADIFDRLAWKARGSGYANRVTQAGAEAFRDHIRTAYQKLLPLLDDQPSASTLRLAIDVAMASGNLNLARELSKKIQSGPHVDNPGLHNSLAFMLLPRWYGKPGNSEGYRDSVADTLGGAQGDILYAQLVALMIDAHGLAKPLSTYIEFDAQRVVAGTERFYQRHTSPELLDKVVLLLAAEKKRDLVKQLLHLRAEKGLVPSVIAATAAVAMRTLEQQTKE